MEAWLPPACLTHNIEEPPPPPPLLPIDILSAAEVVTYRPTKLRRKVSGGGGNDSSGSNCTGTICPKSVSHALIISAISNQQSFALDRQSQQQFWQPLVVVVVEVLYDDIVGPKGQQQSVRVCTQGATAEFAAAATVFPDTTTTPLLRPFTTILFGDDYYWKNELVDRRRRRRRRRRRKAPSSSSSFTASLFLFSMPLKTFPLL